MARTDAVNPLSPDELRFAMEASRPIGERLLRVDRWLRSLGSAGEHGSMPYVALRTLRELAQHAALGEATNRKLQRELTAHERRDAQEIRRAKARKGIA